MEERPAGSSAREAEKERRLREQQKRNEFTQELLRQNLKLQADHARVTKQMHSQVGSQNPTPLHWEYMEVEDNMKLVDLPLQPLDGTNLGLHPAAALFFSGISQERHFGNNYKAKDSAEEIAAALKKAGFDEIEVAKAMDDARNAGRRLRIAELIYSLIIDRNQNPRVCPSLLRPTLTTRQRGREARKFAGAQVCH